MDEQTAHLKFSFENIAWFRGLTTGVEIPGLLILLDFKLQLFSMGSLNVIGVCFHFFYSFYEITSGSESSFVC